jgi:hypothetical protein
MVRNKSLSLPRRRKGGRRFYADTITKSLLGHRTPSDFAEEKANSGFVRYFFRPSSFSGSNGRE